MREIKFREWDSIRQEAYGRNGLSYGDREDCDDMVAFRFLHTEYMGEDLIKDRVLEQYTGLKDVNGVEIYEGDLFTCSHVKSNVFSVEFYNGAFWGIPEKGYGHSQPLSYFADYLEVIGNIHEQLELLEEK